MVDGTLNEDLFRSTIGALIDRARASVSNGCPGKVRIFGEMGDHRLGQRAESKRRLDVVLFWALDWPVNDRVGSFLWVPRPNSKLRPFGEQRADKAIVYSTVFGAGRTGESNYPYI